MLKSIKYELNPTNGQKRMLKALRKQTMKTEYII